MTDVTPDDVRRIVREARSEGRVPDLRRVNLSGKSLSDLGLTYEDLTDTGLTYKDLSDMALPRANLTDANLRGV